MKSKRNNIYSIILAGGSGTRLWPVSRTEFPKQFTKLVNGNSLISATIQRTSDITDKKNIFVVLGENHRNHLLNELEKIDTDKKINILTEPCSRNTAPAILLACLEIIKIDEDAVVLVFPADHIIDDHEVFYEHITRAVGLAELGYLVTFGIKPFKPETGYGYIESGDEIEYNSRKVKRFVEKPDLKTAAVYLESDNYYWNSGMFAFKASVIIHEYEKLANDIYLPIRNLAESNKDSIKGIYQDLPNISIDYAIMEKTEKAAVLPSRFNWSDIGSWQALYDYLPKDGAGNVSAGDVILNETENCLIKSSDRLVVTNWLKNTAIIETDDVVFVSDINKTQEVKSLVEKLKLNNRDEVNFNKTVYKPWGYYTDLCRGDGFRVKKVTVYPGKRLSLQKHKHRSENWLVVNGVAKIKINDDVMELFTNQTAFIPAGAVHRLENCWGKELEIIETQFGDYLEEDDIVRIEDDFGRA